MLPLHPLVMALNLCGMKTCCVSKGHGTFHQNVLCSICHHVLFFCRGQTNFSFSEYSKDVLHTFEMLRVCRCDVDLNYCSFYTFRRSTSSLGVCISVSNCLNVSSIIEVLSEHLTSYFSVILSKSHMHGLLTYRQSFGATSVFVALLSTSWL